MTRVAVLLPLAVGVLVLLAIFVGKRLKRSGELGDGICLHGVCPDVCPSCRPLPPRFVGRAVVAVADLYWQVDLNRFYADYDKYRTELRLPGEGR